MALWRRHGGLDGRFPARRRRQGERPRLIARALDGHIAACGAAMWRWWKAVSEGKGRVSGGRGYRGRGCHEGGPLSQSSAGKGRRGAGGGGWHASSLAANRSSVECLSRASLGSARLAGQAAQSAQLAHHDPPAPGRRARPGASPRPPVPDRSRPRRHGPLPRPTQTQRALVGLVTWPTPSRAGPET